MTITTYSARFFATIPSGGNRLAPRTLRRTDVVEATVAPHHFMSLPVSSPTDLAAIVATFTELGWAISTSEAVDGLDPETGQPADFDYDFHLFVQNACPVCGSQVEYDAQPSMAGFGFDHSVSCAGGHKIGYTDEGEMTARDDHGVVHTGSRS